MERILIPLLFSNTLVFESCLREMTARGLLVIINCMKLKQNHLPQPFFSKKRQEDFCEFSVEFCKQHLGCIHGPAQRRLTDHIIYSGMSLKSPRRCLCHCEPCGQESKSHLKPNILAIIINAQGSNDQQPLGQKQQPTTMGNHCCDSEVAQEHPPMIAGFHSERRQYYDFELPSQINTVSKKSRPKKDDLSSSDTVCSEPTKRLPIFVKN